MRSDTSRTLARPASHPVVRTLAAFPVACFTCALFTDIAYVQTARMMWSDFSDWLLAVGMAGGVVAAAAGLIGLLASRGRVRSGPVWPVAIGSVFVLITAFFNNLVHSRDAWTSVMPTGLGLSILTVLLMLATAVVSARVSYPAAEALPYGGVRP